MALEGAFTCVPKSVAPNEDKGIYFEKAMADLEHLLIKYRRLNGCI